MRAAKIRGRLYRLGSPQDVRKALNVLREESADCRVDASLNPFIRFQPELITNCIEDWQTPDQLEKTRKGDCEDISNRAAKGLRDLGHDAETFIIKHPRYLHIIVECDGRLFDPCYSAGMIIDPEYRKIIYQKGIILV